jgi:hypothetical protein
MTLEKHNEWVKKNIYTITLADLESLLNQYALYDTPLIIEQNGYSTTYAEMIDIVKAELKRRKG